MIRSVESAANQYPPYAEQPLTPEKKDRGISLIRFINQMFIDELYGYPFIKKPGQVAPMIMHLVREIEPLCQANPSDPNDNTLNFFIRGSSIKRYALGTPPGYWQVSKVFQKISPESLTTPLPQAVVAGLAKGPRDIDIRYCLNQEATDQEVKAALETSLKKDHFIERDGQFFRGRDYRTVVVPAVIGGVVGPARIFYSVEFYYQDKYVMRADFGRAASYLEDEEDFRLSSASSGLEVFATGTLLRSKARSKDGQIIYLQPTADLNEYLKTPQAVKFGFSPSKFTNTFFNLLKGVVGNLIFWPKRDRLETSDEGNPDPGLIGLKGSQVACAKWNVVRSGQNYSVMAIFEQLKQAGHFYPGTDNPHLLSWEESTHSQELEPKEVEKLQQRRREFASEFLLYLTCDPGLFLKLAFETHLLNHVPLGKIIDSRAKLNSVLVELASSLGLDREDFLRLPESSLPLLSYLYKQDQLVYAKPEFKYSGSMMLIKALKEANLLKSFVPENVTTIISLVDPLSQVDISTLQGSPYLSPELAS